MRNVETARTATQAVRSVLLAMRRGLGAAAKIDGLAAVLMPRFKKSIAVALWVAAKPGSSETVVLELRVNHPAASTTRRLPMGECISKSLRAIGGTKEVAHCGIEVKRRADLQ